MVDRDGQDFCDGPGKRDDSALGGGDRRALSRGEIHSPMTSILSDGGEISDQFTIDWLGKTRAAGRGEKDR